MKKIAFEAWEKNKDKIMKYTDDAFNQIRPLLKHKTCFTNEYIIALAQSFLEDVIEIAFDSADRPIVYDTAMVGKSHGMLVAICTDAAVVCPDEFDIFYTVLKYGCEKCDFILNANTGDDLYSIAKDIVLSAKPLDENYCATKWKEDYTV